MEISHFWKKTKGQEIWSKTSHSTLLLFKRPCHSFHYLLSVHFAIKYIFHRAIGKIISNLFRVTRTILVWKGDYLLVGYFPHSLQFFVVCSLSFLQHKMFSSPYSFGPVALCWWTNNSILELYVVRKRKGKQWTLIFSFLNAIMCNFLSYLQ